MRFTCFLFSETEGTSYLQKCHEFQAPSLEKEGRVKKLKMALKLECETRNKQGVGKKSGKGDADGGDSKENYGAPFLQGSNDLFLMSYESFSLDSLYSSLSQGLESQLQGRAPLQT